MYKLFFIVIGLLGLSCVAQSQNAPDISNDGSQTITPSPDDLKNAKSAMPTINAAPPMHNGLQSVTPQQSAGEAGSSPKVKDTLSVKPADNIQDIDGDSKK